jgi:hypothetical protein
MAEINSLNVVDASNTARFPENQLPSTVNNGARALEGIIARWDKDTNGSITPGGTADVITIAANQTLSAYYDGLVIAFEAAGTNTGAVTVNVDALGAKSIVKPDGSAMAAGDIVSGSKVIIIYDGTNFQIVSFFADSAQYSLSEEWATKITGIVADGEYSSKAYAIGGTGVTDTAGKGAAKEWATAAEDDLVDGSEYSAKHYSIKSNASAVASAASAVTAATSETAAAASAVAAAASETAAGVSETNAAASAAAAAAVADDIIFNDVVYITNAASPYTLLTTQSGVLLVIDTSGGAVTVNLPSIASAGDGWRISAKKTTGDANFVTFARNGTDTIDGNTSDTITTVGQSKTYVADTDGTPDDWTSVNFGSTLGRTWTHFTYTASGGETSVTGADDDGVVLAYQAGQVKVYLEGLLLDDSDYTATNGTSITGLAALLVGQTLYIEAWDNVMSLGTMAAQNASAVAITGGTLAGITSINAVTPATAQYTTALDTKLGGIEALADVTDATNVTAAGALMDSELTDIAAVKALDQGVATTDSPTFAALTASGDAIVDNLGTGGISPVRDLHVSNAGTNVFAQWTNNTTGHTTTDGWLSGMPNGTDFRYYGYEVGGVFTFYPEETLSLTVAKLGVTVAGTLSAGATTVTTLGASGEISGTSGVAISGGTANTSVDIALPNTNFLAWYDAAATGATTAYIQGSGGAITVNGSSLTFSGGNSDFLANNIPPQAPSQQGLLMLRR